MKTKIKKILAWTIVVPFGVAAILMLAPFWALVAIPLTLEWALDEVWNSNSKVRQHKIDPTFR